MSLSNTLSQRIALFSKSMLSAFAWKNWILFKLGLIRRWHEKEVEGDLPRQISCWFDDRAELECSHRGRCQQGSKEKMVSWAGESKTINTFAITKTYGTKYLTTTTSSISLFKFFAIRNPAHPLPRTTTLRLRELSLPMWTMPSFSPVAIGWVAVTVADEAADETYLVWENADDCC